MKSLKNRAMRKSLKGGRKLNRRKSLKRGKSLRRGKSLKGGRKLNRRKSLRRGKSLRGGANGLKTLNINFDPDLMNESLFTELKATPLGEFLNFNFLCGYYDCDNKKLYWYSTPPQKHSDKINTIKFYKFVGMSENPFKEKEVEIFIFNCYNLDSKDEVNDENPFFSSIGTLELGFKDNKFLSADFNFNKDPAPTPVAVEDEDDGNPFA